MTRDTDHASRFRHRAKRPIRTLTASLLTLACSVGVLTQTADAESRTTRELNAAAAAAGGRVIHQVEGAVRTPVASVPRAADGIPVPQAPPVRRAGQTSVAGQPVPKAPPVRPAGQTSVAGQPVPKAPPVRRAGQTSVAGQSTARATPRAQVAVALSGLEQRQIQRVAALKGQKRRWSCVPFARQLTGFQISGDAWRWWDAAAGRHGRGRTPQAGSVIVLKRSGRIRQGHVAVVRRVVGAREIIVDHANWAPRGRVNEPTRVIDVSRNNDWSQTRFWHQPTGQMGTTVYPTYGFVYASSTQVAERPD